MADKQELSLQTDAEIEQLLHDFVACRLPICNWTHRAHLAVAVAVCSRMGREDSLVFLRSAINAYNRTVGNPTGYNETVTCIFVRKIHGDINSAGHLALALNEHLARLSSLCSVAWMYQYYTPQLIWSSAAQRAYLPPDICPLDF